MMIDPAIKDLANRTNPYLVMIFSDPKFEELEVDFWDHFRVHHYYLNTRFKLNIPEEKALTSFANYVIESVLTSAIRLGYNKAHDHKKGALQTYLEIVQRWDELKMRVPLNFHAVIPDDAVKHIMVTQKLGPWWRRALWSLQLTILGLL